MKRLFKISLIFLICVLLTVGASFLVGAEEESYAPPAPTFLPETVTATPDASLSDYAYIVYDNEADFLEDIDDGVFDGKIGGFEAIVSSMPSGSFTMPTGGYVYMLEDCIATEASELLNVQLQLNLGGNKLTLNSGAGYNSVGGSSKIAIFNGTLDDLITGQGHGAFRCSNGNPSFALRDLNMTSNVAWGNTETFAVEAGGSYYFEKVTALYNGGGKALFSFTTSEDVVASASLVFKNVKFTSTQTALIRNHTTAVGNSTLYFDKDTSITGNTFLWTNAISSTSYVVSAEVGASFTDISFMGSAAVGFVTTADGATDFVLVNDRYVLTASYAFIYWYDAEGNLVSDEPTYVFSSDVTPPELKMEILPDGEGGYKYSTFDWSKTPGGEPTPDFSGLVGECRFYAVAGEAKSATVLLLGEEGVPTHAWDVTDLTEEFLGTLSSGDCIKLLRDFEISSDIDEYPGSITVDLGGNTLTHSGTKWYTPARNVTVTLKNGTLVNTESQVLIYANADSGALRFHDCTIASPGILASLYGGRLVMELCRITQDGGKNTFLIGETGKTEHNDVTVELLGTYYCNKKPNLNMLFSIVGLPGEINIRIGEYDGVYSSVQTGNALQLTSDGKNATDGETKINIELDGVYLYAKRALTSGNLTWGGEENAELTAKNVSVLFNNFFGSEDDYLGEALIAAATKNIDATDFQKVYAEDAETGELYEWASGGIITPNLKMLSNLTLYADIDLNLFIPFSGSITEIKVSGNTIFDRTNTEGLRVYTDRASGEKYYVVTLADLAPNTAAQRFILDITYATGVRVMDSAASVKLDLVGYLSRSYSVVDYIDSFLGGEYSAAANEAVKALVAYITTCYDIFASTAVSDVATLDELRAIADSLGVTEYLEATEPKEHENDTDFDASLGVRASFEIGVVTKLNISFPTSVEYKIKIGKRIVAEGSGGEVTLELRAYELGSVISITAGGETATFSLGEYAEQLLAGGEQNYELALRALYAYGEAAATLKVEMDSAGLL